MKQYKPEGNELTSIVLKRRGDQGETDSKFIKNSK